MTQRPDRGFLDGFNTVWGKQRSRAAHPPQQRNTATSQGTSRHGQSSKAA